MRDTLRLAIRLFTLRSFFAHLPMRMNMDGLCSDAHQRTSLLVAQAVTLRLRSSQAGPVDLWYGL